VVWKWVYCWPSRDTYLVRIDSI